MHLCGRDSNNQRRVKKEHLHNNSQQVTAVTAVEARTNAAERQRRQQPSTRQARGQIRNHPATERCGVVALPTSAARRICAQPRTGLFLWRLDTVSFWPRQKEMGSNPALSPPQASVKRFQFHIVPRPFTVLHYCRSCSARRPCCTASCSRSSSWWSCTEVQLRFVGVSTAFRATGAILARRKP